MDTPTEVTLLIFVVVLGALAIGGVAWLHFRR
jgi:hypothetical protein